MQVSLFIVDSDGPGAAGPNFYYANTFGTDVAETTPDLGPNTDDAISNAVLSFTPTRGSSNIAAGLSDLAVQFGDLTGAEIAYAGIAMLITDGTAIPAAPLRAAVTALKDSTLSNLGIPVTVGVVGVGPFVNVAELNSIASTGADGSPLVALTNFFDTTGDSLRELLANIGAHLCHVNPHHAYEPVLCMVVRASLHRGVAGGVACVIAGLRAPEKESVQRSLC